jgi:hypothetical protein
VLALVVGLLLLADMVMSLRVGSHFGGDARYHIARVRILLDHGFNNWDPLVPGQRFDAIYHSNLYHALIACAGQLSGQAAPEAWAYTWAWAKLASTSAIFHLAWTVFRDRALAWCAAAAAIVWMAPSSILPYPNTIARYALLPLLFAFLVDAVRREDGWRAVAGLGALALVLPQVHGLYYVFAGFVGVPVLLAACAVVVLRRLPGRGYLLAGALVLALGAPWIGVSWTQRTGGQVAEVLPPPIQDPALASRLAGMHERFAADGATDAAVRKQARGFVASADGRMRIDPVRSLRLESPMLHLCIALAMGLFSRRRRVFIVLAGITALVMTVLYTPALCTAFVKLVGAPWIARRFEAIPATMLLAIVPGVLLAGVLDRWRGQTAMLASLVCAMAYAFAFGIDRDPWTRSAYLAEAMHPRKLAARLDRLAAKRSLVMRAIPSQAVVAAPLHVSGDIVMNCDCYRLALDTDEPPRGVRDMNERRAAVTLLFNPDAPLAQRALLLRRYGVRHLYVPGGGGNRLVDSYAPITTEVTQVMRTRVLALDPDRIASHAPAR